MKFFMIRHTHVSLPPGICYGQSDIETASTFAEEVVEIRKRLMTMPFEIIYSSPLVRCLRLARVLAGERPIQTDVRLMELNFGAWEQQSWESINASETGQRWFADFCHLPCPGGESYYQMISRVNAFYHAMKTRHTQDSNILIVTHSGVMRAMQCIVENRDPVLSFNHSINYGSIIQLNDEK